MPQYPINKNFSSGPCAKRPGWSLNALSDAAIGRSHRSSLSKAKLKEVLDRSRRILNLPDDYLIGIVPASDTGAVEMALWSLLGARGVDVLAWESFSNDWAIDARDELKLQDLNVITTDYGLLPDFSKLDQDRDIVFPWNGTTSGVKVPNGDWIKEDREGLLICDATSAVFAMNVPIHKLDVVTYSWQKAMGGEAAHGILILSPRAVKRIESFTPPRALPKIFRMAKYFTSGKNQLIAGIFEGETINTPSMIAIEDAIDGLKWAESIGGLLAMQKRSLDNFNVMKKWVARTEWVEFLASDPMTISNTSVCLKIVDPEFLEMSSENQASFAKNLVKSLEKDGIAFDFGSYKTAPAGLRIWCGSTIEASDLELLTEWLDIAFAKMNTINLI